ncbi:MAG: hypothetical protein OXF44_14140 [Anaerolineaceae bacterium]|nr:hypothetical protein [Anaerolineaceae bacterium]
MKLLVTGGAGYIGSHVTDLLVAHAGEAGILFVSEEMRRPRVMC